jgi:dihydrofolate synthase / folylpolyglutamate synthase
MNYRECLRYLEQIQNLGMKFGLDNVRAVLHALHNPHVHTKYVQVAGSNGKGSVSAMLSRIISLHGSRCGLYTSPHLMHMEERIRIDGECIPSHDLCLVLTDIKTEIDALVGEKVLAHPPTYFEIMTLAALVYFRRRKVDAAVLEVGMGGRFDATTVVKPSVTVITTISREHEQYLGETPAKIAEEKAGIIKKGVPVISGVLDPAARKVIQNRAEAAGAPFRDVFSPESCFHKVPGKEQVYSLVWYGENFRFTPSLPGRHQGRNAAVALAAALEMGRSWMPLRRSRIIQGLESTRWEGRLEVIQTKPFVILDGAHNEEGALALKDYLQEYTERPIFLIFAVMQDKNIRRLGDILFPLAEKVYVTRFNYHRAASPEQIANAVPQFSGRMKCESHPGKALQSALNAAGNSGVVVAAGSLYLIGTIKNVFRRMKMSAPLT